MSLAAARTSGVIGEDRVASAAKPKKGNVLAKLFGFTSADLDRIGCDDCRRVATRMADARRERSAMAQGGRI